MTDFLYGGKAHSSPIGGSLGAVDAYGRSPRSGVVDSDVAVGKLPQWRPALAPA